LTYVYFDRMILHVTEELFFAQFCQVERLHT